MVKCGLGVTLRRGEGLNIPGKVVRVQRGNSEMADYAISVSAVGGGL